MRAVTFREFGGPQVLQATEVERPQAGPDDVLVRFLKASGRGWAFAHGDRDKAIELLLKEFPNLVAKDIGDWFDQNRNLHRWPSELLLPVLLYQTVESQSPSESACRPFPLATPQAPL